MPETQIINDRPAFGPTLGETAGSYWKIAVDGFHRHCRGENLYLAPFPKYLPTELVELANIAVNLLHQREGYIPPFVSMDQDKDAFLELYPECQGIEDPELCKLISYGKPGFAVGLAFAVNTMTVEIEKYTPEDDSRPLDWALSGMLSIFGRDVGSSNLPFSSQFLEAVKTVLSDEKLPESRTQLLLKSFKKLHFLLIDDDPSLGVKTFGEEFGALLAEFD